MAPSSDPSHVTLFYDHTGNLQYQIWFNDNLEGKEWQVSTPGIVLGPEGVVAPITLSPEWRRHYKMGPHSAPYLALAVERNHQAKNLGPMIAANTVTDCRQTDIPQLYTSLSHPNYWFIKIPSKMTILINHQQIKIKHGGEEDNDQKKEWKLKSLPSSLWVHHQVEVGLLNIPLIRFNIDSSIPIHITQYPPKTEAVAGIRDTINSLLTSGVIYLTSSP